MSGPLKVVVCRDIGKDALDILNIPELEIVLWKEDRPADREWTFTNLKQASGILVMLTDKVDEALLASGVDLKVVSTMSVGYEHVDIGALAKRGIKLGYTPEVLTAAVADVGVMLALMASRNVGQAISVVSEGKWSALGWAPFSLCGPQIGAGPSQKQYTVGFIGFGRIAQATLDRLAPFGISKCLYTTSGRKPNRDDEFKRKYGFEVRQATQDEVLSESDLLFTLVPGGPETYHLVNEEFLRKMKPTSIFVNPSRGTIVDSHALAKALKGGWIWGAGLDVLEGEPHITVDHPLVKEPRAIVLPHIGSATLETRVEMAKRAARNLVNGLLGRDMEAEVQLG